MASKVVLVTASSAGLGAATAIAFARNGFRVAINYYSNKDKAERLRAEIEKMTTCIAIRADVVNSEDVRQLVGDVVERFGRLDVVVSNQGWTRIRNFTDLEDNVDDDDWDECFEVNVKSHMRLFHVVAPHLRSTEGAFVSVASLAGVKPSGSSIPYAVTKAAQIHLIKALAKISGPSIRVNSVAPGILLTEWGKQFSASTLDAATNKAVLNRFAEVEDVARQILSLAESRSITGQNVVIDAGWSLG